MNYFKFLFIRNFTLGLLLHLAVLGSLYAGTNEPPAATMEHKSKKAEAVNKKPAAKMIYKSEKAKAIIKNLEWAKKLVEQKGKKAFEAIREHNKKDPKGMYVTIFQRDGKCLLHPNPDLENSNLISLLDENGNPIIKLLLENATPNGNWIHYLWGKKGGFFPDWKSTCVMQAFSPSGKEYLLACGDFGIPMEDRFVADFVENFVKLFREKGRASFAEFKKKSSRVIYKDTYIFILDSKGTMLFNPASPSIESRNMYDYKDFRGKYIFREMINYATKNGSGMVAYYWNAPNKKNVQLKRSFIKKVEYGNRIFIVGSGYFPADYNYTQTEKK